MMNSVSSNDISMSDILLENENNHICNHNYAPIYILLYSFLVSVIIFGICYIFFM